MPGRTGWLDPNSYESVVARNNLGQHLGRLRARLLRAEEPAEEQGGFGVGVEDDPQASLDASADELAAAQPSQESGTEPVEDPFAGWARRMAESAEPVEEPFAAYTSDEINRRIAEGAQSRVAEAAARLGQESAEPVDPFSEAGGHVEGDAWHDNTIPTFTSQAKREQFARDYKDQQLSKAAAKEWSTQLRKIPQGGGE